MNILKHIPNLFTLGNLSCGILAIQKIFQEDLKTAVYLVVLAAILDFFDGFLARLFKVSGELGKQLDSLADLVTFGVAPAFMVFSLANNINEGFRYAFLLPAIFSAYRLAKFNIDKRQSHSFIGVPTPITGIMMMSWAMIDIDSINELIFDYNYGFLIFCILISYLLISEIKLPSLKFSKGPLKNFYQHILLFLIGLISLILWGWLCVPIFYVSYVLSSILFNFATKKSK